jgi:hypothetical protein
MNETPNARTPHEEWQALTDTLLPNTATHDRARVFFIGYLAAGIKDIPDCREIWTEAVEATRNFIKEQSS